MCRILICCLLAFLSVCGGRLAAQESITTATLLDEMVDMVRLGQFPEPAFRTVQFSSYDRRSSVPGGPDWFANSDGFGQEPIPNFEEVLEAPNDQGVGRYLICDVQGAGALVRTWSAAIEGTLRVHLDDADEPLFEGPAQEFLQRGMQGLLVENGLTEAEYLGSFRQRDACYFPIPFSSRCRIEWSGDPRKIHFYEVQVRQYAHGTQVVGLKKANVPQYVPAARRVAKVLQDPLRHWAYRSDRDAVPVDVRIPAGNIAEGPALEGPQAIERVTLKVAAENLDLALRQTILQMQFDEHGSSQVQCPIGDFFGAAPGINPYNAVPFTVEPDGTMTCRFVMPFARKCRIRFDNRGAQEVTVTGSVLPLPWSWDPARSMHFRARWRVDHDLVARPGAGAQDLPFVVAQGSGVYVGTAIMLLNPNSIPTPYGNWWGEGDEKIFVDDDARPSTFGTGSEDYFNYSWSSPDIFAYPYCGQPRNDGPANRGFVVNHRWHIMDALPFHKRLAFYMELYSHQETRNFSYARVGYHYGRPGLTDDFVELTNEDVRGLRLPDNWQPLADFGARNSVFYQAEELVRTREHTSSQQGELWSGGKLLTWTPQSAKEELPLEISVSDDGKYTLHVTAAQTPQATRVLASLDGQPLPFATEDGSLDLRTDFRVQLRDFVTHELQLSKGTHRLTLRVAEDPTAPQAAGVQPTIGIDFIWLQKP
jgi:hypothetical protein